ncbi:hypothetical protein Bca4012_098952 [Brassica carinata]
MAKWSAIVLIMMVVIAVAVTVEANKKKECFHKCSKPCKPHHGNCFKHCKAKCGDTNPHHGPGGHHHGPGGHHHGPPPRQNFT